MCTLFLPLSSRGLCGGLGGVLHTTGWRAIVLPLYAMSGCISWSAGCPVQTRSSGEPCKPGTRSLQLPLSVSRKTSALFASSSGRPIVSPCRILGGGGRQQVVVSCSAAAASAPGSAEPIFSDISSKCLNLLQPTALLFAAIVQFVLAVAAKSREAVVTAFPQVVDIKAEVRGGRQ